MKKISLISIFLLALVFSLVAQESTTKMRNILEEDPIYGQSVINDVADPDYFTGGDYLFRAGTRYLGGFVFSVIGAAVITSGTIKNEKYEIVTGYAVAGLGVIMTLSGHIQLRKAGRAYNKEVVHLASASEGIGLALKF